MYETKHIYLFTYILIYKKKKKRFEFIFYICTLQEFF